METYAGVLYSYEDAVGIRTLEKLPSCLRFGHLSEEALVLRLFLGRIKIRKNAEPDRIICQYTNYTSFPYARINRLTFDVMSRAISVDDIRYDSVKRALNLYFMQNRKNSRIYKSVLFELTSAMVKTSPMEQFIHLYRCLEHISFSFPLIYATITRDYAGTYNSLKSFVSGKNELGFLKAFLRVLFEDDQMYDTTFEMNVDMDNIDIARTEFSRAFEKIPYSFEQNRFCIKYKDMISFIIIVRNRYFHFFTGQENRSNLVANEYDISDFFRAINPHIINWFGIVFCKMLQHGLESISIVD